MRVIAPPFFGEFGIMVLDHLRWVHTIEADEVVVCTEKDTECLYPRATEFFTDYVNPIPDANRCNNGPFQNGISYLDQITAVYQRIVDRYPGVEILEPTYGHRINGKLPDRTPNMAIKPPLKARSELQRVDVCVCPRYRQIAPEKNWSNWPHVVTQLRLMGLRVGIVGAAETCYPLMADAYALHHSGGATEGTIDLLSGCKMFLGTDTGISHIAAMMDIPMVVFGLHDATNPDLTPLMKAANANHCEVLGNTWDDPEAVIDEVVSYLDNRRHGKNNTAYTEEVCCTT